MEPIEGYYSIAELAKIMHKHESTAQKRMKKFNDELKAQGYETVAGICPVWYCRKRLALDPVDI